MSATRKKDSTDAISEYVRAYMGRRKVREAYKETSREVRLRVKECVSAAQECLDQGAGSDTIGPVVCDDRAFYIRRTSRKRAVKDLDIEASVGELDEGACLSQEEVVDAFYTLLADQVQTFHATVSRSPAPGPIEPSDARSAAVIQRFSEADAQRKACAHQITDECRPFTERLAECKESVIRFLHRKGDKAAEKAGRQVRSKKIAVETKSGNLDMTLASTTAARKRSVTLPSMRKRSVVERAVARLDGLRSGRGRPDVDGEQGTDEPEGTFVVDAAFRNALIVAIKEECADMNAQPEMGTSLAVRVGKAR